MKKGFEIVADWASERNNRSLNSARLQGSETTPEAEDSNMMFAIPSEAEESRRGLL